MTNNRLNRRGTMPLAILGHALGFTFAIATTAAQADVIDFEDLPSLLEQHPAGSFASLGPNYYYHRFNFSAVDDAESATHVPNSWYYVNVPERLQDPPSFGDVNAFYYACESGEFAATIAPMGLNQNELYQITRLDGTLWTMDGAMFTRNIVTGGPTNPGVPLRIRGYVGSTLVYSHTQQIYNGFRTFVAPPPGLLIDRITIRQVGIEIYFGAYMDDMQYTLVPAPSALGLLALAGVMQRRRR